MAKATVRPIKPSPKRPKRKQRRLYGPLHPWRVCPIGQHWVRAHERRGTKGVAAHCRNNPSGRDQIYLDEIQEIAEREFAKLDGAPCAYDLDFPNGSEYDALIRGWTKYWNEIFQPSNPLDPDLVKALIATESGFRPNIKNRAGKKAGWARGLMQVTDWTLQTLKDEEGEVRDHLVDLDQKDMTDPSANITAGIRWLFRKKETASAKLKREATWEEAIADYKAYLNEMKKNKKAPRPMQDLREYYERLKKKCEN